jgi:hypothetical protein
MIVMPPNYFSFVIASSIARKFKHTFVFVILKAEGEKVLRSIYHFIYGVHQRNNIKTLTAN